LLKKEIESSEVWEDLEKQKELSKKIAELEEIIYQTENLKKEAEELVELSSLGEEDLEIKRELIKRAEELKKRLSEVEMRTFLNGPYDKRSAILTIKAGVGGRDAQDWATMLLRMYQRFCQKRGFDVKILSHAFGEPGPEGRIGTKEAVLEVKGDYAYGILKKEQGAHRLVRLSPFSAQNLRHTSFASVEVIPVLPEVKKQIEIRPDDLKIETFRRNSSKNYPSSYWNCCCLSE